MRAILTVLGVAAVALFKALPLVKGIAFAGYRHGARGIVIFIGIVAAFGALGLGWRLLKAWLAGRTVTTVG